MYPNNKFIYQKIKYETYRVHIRKMLGKKNICITEFKLSWLGITG